MEGLTFSAGHQASTSEVRNAPPVTNSVRSDFVPKGDKFAQPQQPPDKTRADPEVAKVEAKASPFQARLNYDRDKAQLFVEILDQATGDVVQRIPAETAADTIHELTGGYGGTVVDKIA